MWVMTTNRLGLMVKVNAVGMTSILDRDQFFYFNALWITVPCRTTCSRYTGPLLHVVHPGAYGGVWLLPTLVSSKPRNKYSFPL